MAESKTSTSERPGRSRSLARRDPFLSPFLGSFSPFELMRRMSDEMDRMFERFHDEFRGARRSLAPGGEWTPPIEMFQKGDKLVIRTELPGIRKEDVSVEVADDMVTIQGERREEHKEEREGFYRSELSYGSFYRSIPLPEGAIAESAEATFKDGVLEITMQAPPHEVGRARRLEIKETSEARK
ncbi:MAG TPA: Hsp20/alpha crystallin family protein [Vicinamibacterales bacterium]|nr:Hsp20/alpha crystallin family protein [Vicinamibacterales bacterium]